MESQLRAGVFAPDGLLICEARASYDTRSPAPYIAGFPKRCFENPSSFAINVLMQYDTGAPQATHDAMDYCCEVREN
jgi:hypothetical protein